MEKLQLAAASAKTAKNIKANLFSLIETGINPQISSNTAKNTKFVSVFTETVSKTQSKIADKIQAKQSKITESTELTASLIGASHTPATAFLPAKTASKPISTTTQAPQTTKIEGKNPMAVQNQPEQPAKEAKYAKTADTQPDPADTAATEMPEKTEKLPNETAALRNKGQQGLAQRSETASEHASNVKTATSDAPDTQAQPVIEPKHPKLQTQNKPENAENTQPKIERSVSENSVQAPKTPGIKPQTPGGPQVAGESAQVLDKRPARAADGPQNALNFNFDPATPAKAPGMNPAATIVYVDSPALDNQISAPIASALNRVGQSVSITLNPPELGRMSIKFEQEGTELIGRIEFENAKVGEQLESSLPRVIQNLQDSGVAVREIQLVYKGGEQSYDGLPDNNQANNRGQGQSQDKQHFHPGPGANIDKAADSYNFEPAKSAYVTETAVNMWV